MTEIEEKLESVGISRIDVLADGFMETSNKLMEVETALGALRAREAMLVRELRLLEYLLAVAKAKGEQK